MCSGPWGLKNYTYPPARAATMREKERETKIFRERESVRESERQKESMRERERERESQE